uniref:Fanconi anemia group I protein n=1 Tax=Angiostrongylus cantonensis TaxID=6313 RepID=A0A0K0D2Q6_ANGCA
LPIRRSSDPKHSIKGLARVNLHTVERSLSVIIRHTLLRGCSRPHLFPAALGYLLNLVPYPPPLVIPKADESSWKEVVVGYRQRMNKFVNAFSACENRSDIAEVLLAPSPYISEMARAFIDRMSRVDLRMAQELVESVIRNLGKCFLLLLKYIVTLFESRLSNKYNDNAVTPAGSVTGEEMTKDNEKTRPASTGMVRLMESFIQLCQVHHFRTVLYYFLSRYPSRHRYLLSILSQFEKPTFESERQSRYQTAVLELLSGLCSPSLWSSEFTTFENDECVTSESIEACVFNGVDSPEPLTTVNVQENKNNVDEPMEVIGDELENDDTAVGLELVEETDCDSQPSSSLEATILSLCRFVNNADQKISAVQYALEIMMNATSDALKENNASFLKVLSGCLRRVGLHPFFERMNKSFNSGEVIACLQAATSILDNLYGEQPNLLLEVLDFSPSEHLFPSLISQINDKPNIDANANCVLKIMDRFCKSFKNHPATNGASQEEVEVPLMYGKSVAVAKLYSDPVVTVVTGRSESYKRIKAASRYD